MKGMIVCPEPVGVDFAQNLEEATIATIQDAWKPHHLLLCRDVLLTPAQHVALTRRLGPLHVRHDRWIAVHRADTRPMPEGT